MTANVPHPGVVRTDFGREDHSWLFAALSPLARLAMKTPAAGARTSIHLASSPEVARVTGEYFANRTPRKSSKASYDTAAAARLWRVSAELTGLGDTAPNHANLTGGEPA